jgi:hypothetical protein
MHESPTTSKAILVQALQASGIEILEDQGKWLQLEKEYSVEIEANGIFKLRSEGLVVAPFADVDELCQFIKMG